MTTIQISDELGKRLSELAKRNKISESSYAEEALERFLEDEEDVRLAMEVLAKNEPSVPWETVKKKLGIDDQTLED